MTDIKRVVRHKRASAKRQFRHRKFVSKINEIRKKSGQNLLPELRTPKSKEEAEKPKTRFPCSYVTQQGKKKLRLRKTKCFSQHVRRVRSSIQPGAVLILLAGPHKGKRVVFLKTLKSGLLLVTGPFKYNGVPLRRVNQRYVIATSTRVDLSKVEIPEHIDDEYFRRIDLKERKTDAENCSQLKRRSMLSVTQERRTRKWLTNKFVNQ
ncbi:unnamed protein product [Heterobilharzia americana]|nr:unnamed protein product [Heterobilharzia americana]